MPAGGVQAEKQQRFVRLIAQGSETPRHAGWSGINRKTGTRWRYGRSVINSAGALVHYPAAKLAETGGAESLHASPQVFGGIACGAGAPILLDGGESVVAD